MDSQENFSKINSNNKNLDLEISKSRFFHISKLFLRELKLRKPHPLNLKKIQDLKLNPELFFLYYIYFFSILIFNIIIKDIIADNRS